jgi:hypothetical protein
MARFSTPAIVLAVACTAALGAAPAGAAQASVESAAAVGLGAKLESCSTSDQPGRSAVFSAAMPAKAGANRLQVKFDLFTRPDFGGLWKPVVGVPTFGQWDSATPGAGGLKVTKQVGGLRLGSAYRATVGFRWLDPSGKVVRKDARATRGCVQKDPRPDLAVTARAASASGDVVVVVRNLGRAAGPFELKLSSGGRQLATEKFSGLDAGGARGLVFRDLSCQPGSKVLVSVGPARPTAERREDNNAVELACPASG